MKGFTSYLVSALAATTCAFPSHMLRGLPEVDDETLEKFLKVERDASQAEVLFEEHQRRKAEQRKKRGIIPNPIKHLQIFGGGLKADGSGLNAFKGPLSGILVPKVIKQGLKKIPGNDRAHRFIAPGPTDQRGMCPTLNTLANHGYINRNGISSFKNLVEAIQEGYGFTFGLSNFLSAVGLLAGGDLPTGIISIGGYDKRVPKTLGPAPGLNSHGVFEIDGSITRQDTHFGNTPLHNNANFLYKRWKEYVAVSKKYGGKFNLETQAEDNGNRYDNSKATNPDAFFGAVWFIVSHAERVFIYTGLANGTTPNDANYANVAPFFLDERFPEDWFRRGNPWTLALTFQQAGSMFLKAPRLLGQNNGIGHFSPAGIDVSDPAAFGCFLVKNFFDLNPNQLSSSAYKLVLEKAFFAGAVLPFFTDDGFFNCNITQFTEPSTPSVGITTKKAASSSGSPVDGKYPGIGYIKPDQPSTGL